MTKLPVTTMYTALPSAARWSPSANSSGVHAQRTRVRAPPQAGRTTARTFAVLEPLKAHHGVQKREQRR